CNGPSTLIKSNDLSAKSRQYTSRSERVFLHSDTGRIEERICDRGSGARHHFFTGSCRALIQPLNDDWCDLWCFLETKNGVRLPVEAGHVCRVKGDFFFENPADRLNQLSADLILDVPRIYGQPGIDGAI